MNPPFSFRRRRKENGRSRSKEKTLWCPKPALWAGLDQYGGIRSRCGGDLRGCTGCAWALEQGSASPHVGGVGAAFGAVDERPVLRAPRVPLCCALPGYTRGAAAEREGRGIVKHPGICRQFIAGAGPGVFARLGPRPTLTALVPAQALFPGLPRFGQLDTSVSS